MARSFSSSATVAATFAFAKSSSVMPLTISQLPSPRECSGNEGEREYEYDPCEYGACRGRLPDVHSKPPCTGVTQRPVLDDYQPLRHVLRGTIHSGE